MTDPLRNLHHPFPKPGQPNDVVVWAQDDPEPKHPRVTRLEESGHETVHIRWPISILDDHECDEPHRVAATLTEALSGYVQRRRTNDEYAAFEVAILEWIMKRRGAAALREFAEDS